MNGRFAGAACEQRQCGVNCEMRAVHFVWFRGDEYARACRVFGKPEASDWRSFSLAPQFQTFDQEWLDRVMKSAGADKPREWKSGGSVEKADGGAVNMAEGGMTSDDLIVEERAL